MSARSACLVALVGSAVGLAGCRADKPAVDAASSKSTPPGSQPSGAVGGKNVLTITARDYAFDAPAQIPAGITTIRLVNQGPALHHVQLMKLGEGKRLADFLTALKGERPPTWATPAGGPAPPEVGSTSTSIQALEPGTYALICFIPAADGMPHVMKGMSRELEVVEASRPAGPEPEADLVVTLKDYDFELSRPLTAGKHTIRIDNAGAQPHEIAIVRMNAGKKPLDFTAWGMKPVGPPPGTVHGGLSAIMPKTHSFIEVDLPPGDYGLLCFLPDAKDGKPHFEHGMAKQTKVSSS
ncbi:MAG: hypothetical protein H0T50_00240 [Gemmatimonadales bacterium]|nr:hypothetical protein [Gemmatimonadales bacterium]